MKKILFITVAALMIAVSASAQLKVSSTGNVSVGTTAASASKLSVGSAGHSMYAAYVKGNCKVDSGYVSANVYVPYTLYPLGWSTSDINSSALQALYNLQIKAHTKLNASHYSILGSSMNSYFPALTGSDEHGNKNLNYTELIPVLVYGYKQIVDFLTNHYGYSATSELGSDGELVDDDATERSDTTQNRSRMTSRLQTGAKLFQNTPNPFTAQTTIRFHLPGEAQNAYIYIFDMTGKTLKQLPVDSSMDSVTIEGYELPSGMYLYSLVINGQEIDTKRMILSK